MTKKKAGNNILNRAVIFITDDIWKLELKEKSYLIRFFFQLVKILIVAFKGIKDDRVKLRASALTFFTLLSVVPVLALAFGLAKGFGLDKNFQIQLLESFPGQHEVLLQSFEFAQKLLENTQGGLIAGIGAVFLIYSVMELLMNIEASFNDIWYVRKQRSLIRKITDYITIILVGFIFMIVANSLTVFISQEIKNLTETVSLLGLFKSVIFPLLRLLPYIVVWFMFTLLYMIMPNTSVKFRSAFIGGVVAGTAFQILQWGLIRFEVNISEYNAIYGSFAALPLFLIWLQMSWLIVLYGSEISYATQHVTTYESNIKAEGFSHAFKRKIALVTTLLIVRNFKEGELALSLDQLNTTIKIPQKLLREVLNSLVACHVLSAVSGNEEDQLGYQPAIDTDHITVQYVLDRFDNIGEELPKNTNDWSIFDKTLAQINSTSNKFLLKEMGEN